MPRPTTNTKQKILDTAGPLFYQQGFHAVGIDTIVAESGVAKMTLYRHFPSKQELIVAYLEQTNEQFWGWFEEAIRPYPNRPGRQLLAFFESLAHLVTKPTCLGCPFLIASTEFPEPDQPAHQVAKQHKTAVLTRLTHLAQEAAGREPHTLAKHLLLLMDGAFMQVRVFGPLDNPAAEVTTAAQILLQAYGIEHLE
jgi:AcrR family transcriptional regulator